MKLNEKFSVEKQLISWSRNHQNLQVAVAVHRMTGASHTLETVDLFIDARRNISRIKILSNNYNCYFTDCRSIETKNRRHIL